VSQQVKKLEKEAGFAVLERRGRGVLLTERGLALAAYGRRILAELEELQATLLVAPAATALQDGEARLLFQLLHLLGHGRGAEPHGLGGSDDGTVLLNSCQCPE
jgi:DNA-binding transcriptional LysR family regulator